MYNSDIEILALSCANNTCVAGVNRWIKACYTIHALARDPKRNDATSRHRKANQADVSAMDREIIQSLQIHIFYLRARNWHEDEQWCVQVTPPE